MPSRPILLQSTEQSTGWRYETGGETMKAPRKVVKVNGKYVELNKNVDAWLDQPVSKAGKIFLAVTAVLVAVSVATMLLKHI